MSHRLALSTGTVTLLRHLVGQLVALHDEAPADDPAWQRLYPSTTADPRLDRDLRDLVHPDLMDGRMEAFQVVGAVLADLDEGGSDLELDDDQAVAFLGVVNDIRLALAARIDLPALVDDDGEWPDDLAEETLAVAELVSWLAMLQDHVLASLAPESLDHQRDMVRARLADDLGEAADEPERPADDDPTDFALEDPPTDHEPTDHEPDGA